MPDPDAWADRYRQGTTPWELFGPHPELEVRLADGRLAPGRSGMHAYVPGCGRGGDAIALARAGWRVTAVDVVEQIARERGAAFDEAGVRFAVADALSFDPGEPVDLLVEHTFFCALDPDKRASYGSMCARLTRPGSRIAAIVFPVRKPLDAGGPPFGTDTAAYAAAIGPRFALVEDGFVDHPIPRRSWGERFALFERRAE